jgi:hypothetical protein
LRQRSASAAQGFWQRSKRQTAPPVQHSSPQRIPGFGQLFTHFLRRTEVASNSQTLPFRQHLSPQQVSPGLQHVGPQSSPPAVPSLFLQWQRPSLQTCLSVQQTPAQICSRLSQQATRPRLSLKLQCVSGGQHLFRPALLVVHGCQFLAQQRGSFRSAQNSPSSQHVSPQRRVSEHLVHLPSTQVSSGPQQSFPHCFAFAQQLKLLFQHSSADLQQIAKPGR